MVGFPKAIKALADGLEYSMEYTTDWFASTGYLTPHSIGIAAKCNSFNIWSLKTVNLRYGPVTRSTDKWVEKFVNSYANEDTNSLKLWYSIEKSKPRYCCQNSDRHYL